MNKTRTIIIDGIEIQTSLTGVEITGLVQRNKELEQQVKKQKEVIDRVIKILDIIIYDLEEHEEALPPTKEELCKVFNILKEVSE